MRPYIHKPITIYLERASYRGILLELQSHVLRLKRGNMLVTINRDEIVAWGWG